MIYICSHGNERKHWICPPYLFFLLLWLGAISCYCLFFFFDKAVLATAPLQFLHLPRFLCSPSILFAFFLTLSTFVSTTTSLIIFATSSLLSLPFKSLFTSTAIGKKKEAVEPVFCSVGGLSSVSQEVSTPWASQADCPPRFYWLGYPN